ncbi:MAG: hypothetical protein WC775_06410 [Patescibacteria group bacterium]
MVTTVIKKGLTEKTLLNWYASPQLEVVLEFPDLTEMDAPTLAIDFKSFPAPAINFYGGGKMGDYFFNVWGFAGWESTHSSNAVQRDNLISDMISLLEDGVVPVYDWNGTTKGSLLGYASLINIAGEKIAQSGNSLADKYRFLISGIARIKQTS